MFTNNEILSTDLSTSIPQRRSIFAIFVHYGDWKTTENAIASLLEGAIGPDYIIIIDHADAVIPGLLRPAKLGSEVGTRDPRGFRLTGQNDNVAIVHPEENTGYAGGLVDGLRRAAELGAKATDLCILLNNDVEFKKDNLQQIATWWELHGGPRMLGGAAGGCVSLFSGRAYIVSQIKPVNFRSISYIHGSCLVGEYSLLSSGILPTSFFLYWEDIVISMRVSKKACSLVIIPGLQGLHNDAPSVVSLVKLYYMVRNGAYVLERYTPPYWRVYWYIMNTLRMIYHELRITKKHRLIARALYNARCSTLGRADI